jgi:phosphoglycerol transferase MdoB-like AlkP superfamily enzyme
LLEAGGAYIPVVAGAVFYLVLIGALSWTISANLSSKDQRAKTTPNILVAMVLLALALIADPDLRELTAKGWSAVRHDDSKISTERLSWDLLGLHPAALDNRLAGTTPGKNLLMIYMESLESLYLDDSVFPGLTPNLIRLRNRALNFTALHQLPGTGWTVAGMLSSQCGTPLIYETGPGTNDILQGGFLNRAVCLGDVLKAAGYRQVFMGGATTDFAGKGEFLKAHGYDEINGREQLVRKLDDPGYTNDWGLYDDSLFLLAERRFAELASDRRPFNLTLLTVDTHHPGGNASKSCADYEAMNNSMLDAVHCTDQLVGQFLDRLAHYPAWNDTLVVLLSDHLAMRNVARRYYPANYDRKLFL